MIFVNFKTYSLGTREAALRLAKTCFTVAKNSSIEITPVVQVVDLWFLHQNVGEHLWVQHVDGIGYGPHTGRILPAAVKDAGAKGTLLNHSEYQLTANELKSSVTAARNVGLKILICTAFPSQIKHAAALAPDFIAYEPPELIGGKVSVSTAKPGVIQKIARLLPPTLPLVVGAGIHSAADVKASVNLGAKGILVSSEILTSEDPLATLTELATAFKNL